jgi:hypothetical protein
MTDNQKPQQPLRDNGPSRLPMFRNMNPDACENCGRATCNRRSCLDSERAADEAERFRWNR